MVEGGQPGISAGVLAELEMSARISELEKQLFESQVNVQELEQQLRASQHEVSCLQQRIQIREEEVDEVRAPCAVLSST